MFIIIILYLIVLLLVSAVAIAQMSLGLLIAPYDILKIPLMCIAVACIGGCAYCLRAIYLNKCVHKRWDTDWHTWYFLRPITSTISGGVSYLFLKAGLLILDSKAGSDSSEIGFFALAFIAGLNVDKFFAKIEDVAKTLWGIEKSNATQINPSIEDK
jgi:hypothetical protein